MREQGDRVGRPHRVREHRGARHRRRGRPHRARARRRAATIEAETVVIACGVWSPLLARMAGAHIPLTPAGAPDDRRRPGAAVRERDQGDRVPDRARHGRLHVRAPGRHRASRSAPTRIARSSTTRRRSRRSRRRRSRRPSSRSRRTTSTRSSEHALELMPEIVGDESVGVKYAINGLISLTPDGMPILGETPEVQGPLVGGRGVGQGGPGRRQVGRRVDGARRVAHRPPLVGHRAASTITRRRGRT